MRLRDVGVLLLVTSALMPPAAAAAQAGQRITDVRVEQEGALVTDLAVLSLIETTVGEPLSRAEVRETIGHLMSLGHFEDVRPYEEPFADGIRLRYELVPLHPVDRIELRGAHGVAQDDLRRVITERFGDAPPAARAADVAASLKDAYRERGYALARVTPRVEVSHNPDRASLVLEVDEGPRAVIADVNFRQTDAGEKIAVTEAPAVRAKTPYDAGAIERELREWEERQREKGYYEARASHGSQFDPDGRSVYVVVNLRRGPRVVVVFAGDPIPAGDRDRLVPIRAQASADEDLLEDSARAIEAYFHARGYRDARAEYVPEETASELRITFRVSRGPRHTVHEVRVDGASAVPAAEIDRLLGLRAGDVFVQARLDAGVRTITNTYRNAGYIAVKIPPPRVELLPAADAADERSVDAAISIAEGPRTTVRDVTFTGARALSDADLRALATIRTGAAYSELAVAASRDDLELEYRNRGYETAIVTPKVGFGEDGTAADVAFAITEGPQTLVDDIIIVGNERTKTETIRRELQIAPGQPLGFAALINTRSQLARLGLFRRIEIEPLQQVGDARRDVVIRVTELDPRTFGWGGGIEGGFITRTSETGPQERFEVAPRGFVEFGRRNLWGGNRSVNGFARVSLRRSDETDNAAPLPLQSDYGLNEYRVAGTFSEPRFLDSRAQFQVLGLFEQAIRTSFNFRRREVRAEATLPLTPKYQVLGRYSLGRTEIYDRKFRAEDVEQAQIDRLFPQVRLSKFAGSLLRDTRDDPIDPERGSLTILDVDVSARAIGSEVGFIKSLVQSSWFHRLPGQRRIVFGVNGRLGLARGFEREVPAIGPDGMPTIELVDGLPASERFFAGGASSVRGFSLDRLGNEQTFGPTGFPSGGNSVIVVMNEMRARLFGNVDGIGFFDFGNVYPRVSDFDLTDLRPAVGVGGLYRNGNFGLVRVDVGFNPDRRELVPGTLERGIVWHVSLSQSF